MKSTGLKCPPVLDSTVHVIPATVACKFAEECSYVLLVTTSVGLDDSHAILIGSSNLAGDSLFVDPLHTRSARRFTQTTE